MLSQSNPGIQQRSYLEQATDRLSIYVAILSGKHLAWKHTKWKSEIEENRQEPETAQKESTMESSLIIVAASRHHSCGANLFLAGQEVVKGHFENVQCVVTKFLYSVFFLHSELFFNRNSISNLAILSSITEKTK